MKTIVTFSLLILVASMTLGGMTTNVFAQDDPTILLKLVKHTQEQIRNQIPGNSSDELKQLFEEGILKVDALEESLVNNDIISAQEHFHSSMKIFTEISRQLTTSDVTSEAINNNKNNVEDTSHFLQRLQVHVNNLKTIAKNHNTLINFSELDKLFSKAKQQINDNQHILYPETLQEIKETIAEIKTGLHEEALKQKPQRAQEYAQKYLERLDRLIENAKKQGIPDEIIEKLETSKENLSLTQNPNEIIMEIREIKSIKTQFELTQNDHLESRILQIEQALSRLSQIDGVNPDNLEDAEIILQNVKHHLHEGQFDIADEILQNLLKQVKEIKNSL